MLSCHSSNIERFLICVYHHESHAPNYDSHTLSHTLTQFHNPTHGLIVILTCQHYFSLSMLENLNDGSKETIVGSFG